MTPLLLALLLAGPPADWSAEFATPAEQLSLADMLDAPKRDAAVDAPDPETIRATAAELDREFDADVAVDRLLATRAGQRLVNSALLCQSVELLTAEGKSTATARRRLAAIGVEATARLERAHIAPLSCDAYPVARLVNCMGLLPAAECTTDAELATAVRASERLAP